MYYAVYDLQIGDYLASGFNCTSRKEVKEQLLSLMRYDLADDYNKYKRFSLRFLLDVWEMRLDRSDTEFN